MNFKCSSLLQAAWPSIKLHSLHRTTPPHITISTTQRHHFMIFPYMTILLSRILTQTIWMILLPLLRMTLLFLVSLDANKKFERHLHSSVVQSIEGGLHASSYGNTGRTFDPRCLRFSLSFISSIPPVHALY